MDFNSKTEQWDHKSKLTRKIALDYFNMMFRVTDVEKENRRLRQILGVYNPSLNINKLVVQNQEDLT